ncbi:Uncharacterized protein HZ326_11570 [Fusarium oxysporum f. sp. albedinis]|nr:Uncharacterized protein HZ326_11570 [Fusarium oxysporum f. sp. albedinis]
MLGSREAAQSTIMQSLLARSNPPTPTSGMIIVYCILNTPQAGWSIKQSMFLYWPSIQNHVISYVDNRTLDDFVREGWERRLRRIEYF